MAINNTGPVPSMYSFVKKKYFNESVSLVTKEAPYNSSGRVISPDETTILQSIRAHNGDTVDCYVSFLLVDKDGILHGHFSNDGLDRKLVPAGHALSWNGYQVIPPGFKVYAKWWGISADKACNWQYTAWA